MTSTIGLPLDVILLKCKEKGMVVDWVDYYESALKSGMSTERILTRIDHEVTDVYGSEYRDQIMSRLQRFIKKHL